MDKMVKEQTYIIKRKKNNYAPVVFILLSGILFVYSGILGLLNLVGCKCSSTTAEFSCACLASLGIFLILVSFWLIDEFQEEVEEEVKLIKKK